MKEGDKVQAIRDVTNAELYGLSFGTTVWRDKVAIPKGATGTFERYGGLNDHCATVEWDGERGDNHYAAKFLAVPEDAVEAIR